MCKNVQLKGSLLQGRWRRSIANRLYWKRIDGFKVEAIWLYIKLLKFADTVLDIGAYIGIYALIAATDNPV